MNPVLALGLVAAAGIAVTRLPRLPYRHALPSDLVLAAGTPLVLLGILLGPGIGMLERPVLHALAPVTALAIGWIGAVFGARFEWRYVRRIPPRVWLLVLLQATAVFVIVGLAAWLLARAVPALRVAWVPTLPALLTLAAVAAVSGPGAVALVAHGLGIRKSIAHAFGLAAALDTAFGALGFTLALALYHPREPFVDVVALAVAGGLSVGLLFLLLTWLRPEPADLELPLLGVILLGAGVGYAADLSPFVVCALATTMIVNYSPLRRRVQALLVAWEHPIYAVFLIIAGALLRLPTAWILVAVPLLAALRVVAKWAVVRYAREPLKVPDLPPHMGLAAVAQGGVAVALAINFFIVYGGPVPEGGPPGAVVTTIVLGVLVAQLAAPLLMNRALSAPEAAP